MNTIKNLITLFVENEEDLAHLENEDRTFIEDIINDCIEKNKYTIHHIVEQEYHKEDVLQEIEDRNQLVRDDYAEEGQVPPVDALIILDEETIEELTSYYEQYLACGEYTWREALNFAFEKVGI